MDHITVTPHSENGSVGLLILVEHDTKFCQVYPVRTYGAEDVASKFFKHFCTFGGYDAIYSDPGSAFTSDIIKHLNSWLGIEHRISLVGRHQSNGTEHPNGILMGHLRRLVHDERIKKSWDSDEVLPLINHTLNYYPNDECGGLSPLELKFGTQNYQRFHLPELLPPGNDYGTYLNKLNNNIKIINNITTKFQNDLREERISKTLLQNKYQKDDLVLFNPKENPNSLRDSKLSPKFLGPYRVLSQRNNDISCEHVTLKNKVILHTSRVHPFFGTLEDARKISMVDKDEFLVEEIISHKGDIGRKTSLEFLVKWAGYGSEYNTLEPWSNLRNNSVLHDYLRKNGLGRLVPNEFS
jgi:hypothetical protein